MKVMAKVMARLLKKNTYQDIRRVYQYLTSDLKVPSNRVILMGHSLGAGVALQLATEKPVAGLILISPFLSTYRVITQIPILLFDKYNNINKIQNVHTPLLIIHGNEDTVVPFWQGKTLFKAANEPKVFLSLENVGHNDLTNAGKKYWETIKSFTSSLNN